jgi:hypothetical protein
MAKLLVALLFAVALMFGLSTGSSTTYACNDEAAQAADVTGAVQLAENEDADDDDDDDDDDDGDDGAGDEG